MDEHPKLLLQPPLLLLLLLLLLCAFLRCDGDVSAVGDPGMRRDGLRVAFEAWNFCNEVGAEAPGMGSPRAADCFDLSVKHSHGRERPGRLPLRSKLHYNSSSLRLRHRVAEAHNKLGMGQSFPGVDQNTLRNADLYAAQKEVFLGSLCEVRERPNPWQFWMVMLKNGNYDGRSGLCPQNGKKALLPPDSRKFPCFGVGCMNQPVLYHHRTEISENGTMRGGFNGTYELGSHFTEDGIGGVSFYEVIWEKKIGFGSWVFHHKLKTSKKYPWLMLYLRADATKGLSGGYHYDTRGMLKTLPESPNFKVRFTLDIKQGGGPKSQFYLIDMGSCWKNNGHPCDGDVLTDVTRYSEMIINPETQSWCSPNNLGACPPYHIMPDNRKIYRNDTAKFPYSAYHYYCAPGNALYLEAPVSTCDPYSNPQAQELVQLLPHPVWGPYGYPTRQGDGWIGDGRTWELDVGGLSSRLYFYQDPGTPPAKRVWTSLDVGTEIFVSDQDEMAEWNLSDFDVLLESTKSYFPPFH
ncbi:hypothetical protein MLD38_033456 [Melastoma candidum]|uniref:Uncharacterized protein n=1 Tax=Melastoma candidum TaxID=119954 RepID=A0ACB9M6T8_9MYRT|nr:hypothetical protein MLD38_033456 [Melastoma candidum]